MAVNYWHDFTIERYHKDLLPAAAAMGFQQVFVDNLNRSDMSEELAAVTGGNMCCGHEYEVAPSLGGVEQLRAFVEACRREEIQIMAWTNNDQSLASPLNDVAHDQRGWFVHMEDNRLKYGGAYTNCLSILDLNNDEARQYWVDALIAIREQTGLNGYLFDSFYNLGFMPINYRSGRPTTMWRQRLGAMKQLQDADIHFLIESFGPFGQPQHGCPRTYHPGRCWVCYQINLGDGYTTVPTSDRPTEHNEPDAADLYFVLAHMTVPAFPLFKNGQRIDHRWGDGPSPGAGRLSRQPAAYAPSLPPGRRPIRTLA